MDFIIIMKIFVTLTYINQVKNIPFKIRPKFKVLFPEKYILNIDETLAEGNPLLRVKLKNQHGIDYGHIIPLLSIIVIKNGTDNAKQIMRQNNDGGLVTEEMKTQILKVEHYEKIRQIVNFLYTHMLTTDYFYDEVQRIIKNRIVKDELRKMVSYLENPANAAMKKSLLNYFYYNILGKNYRTTSIWDHKPNDLVINVMKDPFNDGVIN